jgi:hypothetical protein
VDLDKNDYFSGHFGIVLSLFRHKASETGPTYIVRCIVFVKKRKTVGSKGKGYPGCLSTLLGRSLGAEYVNEDFHIRSAWESVVSSHVQPVEAMQTGDK